MMRENDRCRLCGSDALTLFLDLGCQPPANRNLARDEWVTEPEPLYPLQACFCQDCNLVQLRHVVSKEELYREYPFLSSGVGDTPEHFKRYAREMQERFLGPGDLVVEIGGNDGVLLTCLNLVRTMNVEPALNVAAVARSRGVETVPEFFTSSLAARIASEHGKAKLILGNNSIAHIDDQHDLAAGLLELLADDGVFVIQAPYLGDIFETLGYGTIYHEHLSYFAIRPLQRFYKGWGLDIFDCQLVPFQGRSVRLFVGRSGRYPVAESVGLLIAEELRQGWNCYSTYARLAAQISTSRDTLVQTLRSLKAQGSRIAAYGAAAKGMSILNFAGMTHEMIDFCVDGLETKQGLYTPLSHIPIISPEEARKRPVDYYLLLAWNFADAIVQREQEFVARGGKFILPIGDIAVLGSGS